MAFAHDAASLNAIAANSAVAFRASVHEKHGRSDVEVSCVCPPLFECASGVCVSFVCLNVKRLCYARYSGPVEAGSGVTQKTMLRFTWRLLAGEDSQSREVHQLCRHAARRGVHPPKQWKNDLNLGLGVEALEGLAGSAIQRVRDELALPESVKLDCRLWFMHARALILGYLDLGIVCKCTAGTLGPAVLPRSRALT